jgi:DNA-binding transcriptional LysR family regulator
MELHRRLLPSLNALRMFEAVARRTSFTQAAAELGITQAAVSRQIKRLEEEIGVVLFQRHHRTIELTRAGARLHQVVRKSLDEIAAAVGAMRDPRGEPTLAISVSPYFSSAWLTPRLPAFSRLHPKIALRLHHAYFPPDYRREDFDLGINWGDGRWNGIIAEPVLTGALAPMMSPRLARPRKPIDLLRHTLLYEFDIAHWQAWFTQAGVRMPTAAKSLRIDDSHALRQAALDGQGVALFFWGLAQRDLATGRLVQPFPARLEHRDQYFLNYPRHTARKREVKLFRQWLATEIRRNPYA